MTTGARAMSTALMLEDGRRDGGRWKRGSVVQDSELGRAWQVSLVNAGIVLDFAPDLAPPVVAGTATLNDAYTQANTIRTGAIAHRCLNGRRWCICTTCKVCKIAHLSVRW